MKAFFITGTDTEVGKTTVTAGLTHFYALKGYRSVAIKPVAAGQHFSGGRWINDDVDRLLAASNVQLSENQVGPFQFRTPCAPHIAASLEGRTIDRQAILSSIRDTLTRCDIGFVEGVGGFRVPLLNAWDTADLATDLGFPVILVVGIRLGCINHAILATESIQAHGLTLVGWVSNLVDPHMSYVQHNLDSLRKEIKVPWLGHIPHLENPDHSIVAEHLRLNVLYQTLESYECQSNPNNHAIN